MKTFHIAPAGVGFRVMERDSTGRPEKVIAGFVTEEAAKAWLGHYLRLIDAADSVRRTLDKTS